MHPSSGLTALAGKASPHFLPLSVNEVVNEGKALGQQKALTTYQALLLQLFRAWLLGQPAPGITNLSGVHGLSQLQESQI